MMTTLKRILFFLSILTLSLLFGCTGEAGRDGRDGEDGVAYVSIDYTTNATALSVDSFDFIVGSPITVQLNQDYMAVPGGYKGDYWLRDWAYYWFAYSYSFNIEINEGERGERGEEGGMFWQDGRDGRDGEDGKDKYYDIFFNYYGNVSVTFIDRNIKDISESFEGRGGEAKIRSMVEDFTVDPDRYPDQLP